jgi:DNA repair exonuclease SbcCD nuclease subunit
MILFTADWHIKLGQKNVPVEWAKNRYRSFFSQVYKLELNVVDIHIIGGDIFDRVPTIEELELYFEFIKNIKCTTYIYAGNHESTKKGKTFLSNLKDVTKAINPLVEIVDTILEHEYFTLVPYEFINTVKWDKLNKDIPLFTHVRGEIPPHVKPEIDLDLLNDFKVVFAGDLHSHSNTQRNIVYPGSPMTTSFHRKEVDTGYIKIDYSGNWTWHKFDLPQLIRKTVTDPKDMIPTSYHHTIYELEGDVIDLGSVRSTELLDKKLVKRSTEATLFLAKEMTMQDELVEYLTYILEIPEEKIPALIGVYNDYAKRTKME